MAPPESDKKQAASDLAFDLPTQIGYDSDHEMSRGEVDAKSTT